MYDLTFIEINLQEYYEVSQFNKIEMIYYPVSLDRSSVRKLSCKHNVCLSYSKQYFLM